MKYDELMDKIEVTDAMRARILRNVSAAAPKKTPVRRYALLAACLAVVLLGAVCVPKLMDPAPQGEQVAIANGMIEVADAAGTWRTTLDFGGQVHRGLLENEKPDALELLYDKDPARLRAACETLGGEALPGADVSYALPFFEDLRIAVQFWHGDEEFSPRLRFLWDAAADQYLRYETMYYALSLLRTRLQALG